MPDKKIRITVSIPAYYYPLLLWWGYFKGQRIPTLIINIAMARVEANREEIMLMLNARAKELGLTPEELGEKIIKEGING